MTHSNARGSTAVQGKARQARRPAGRAGPPRNALFDLLVRNQTGICVNLVALLFLSHVCIPAARPYTVPFFRLSGYNARTGKYAVSRADGCFVAFCIVLFTGLRAGCIEHVLTPLGRGWGARKRKQTARFAEQAWLFIYYSVFWPLGVYIYCTSPCFLDMEKLWTDWPDRELSGLVKVYILAQSAFWVQQVLVIHIEDRRKDHWQTLTHHFITVALMAASYAYHQTRVANLILILMDISDLIFPLAKCLKYVDYTTICDVLFLLFMLSWFVARHLLFPLTCWSIYTDLLRVSAPGCYRGTMDDLQGPLPLSEQLTGWSDRLEPFHDPAGTVCFDAAAVRAFLACLLLLQLLTVIWFALIVKVALRLVNGVNAADVRSDDEDDDEYDDHDHSSAELHVADALLKGERVVVGEKAGGLVRPLDRE